MSNCNAKDSPASSIALGSNLSGTPYIHNFLYAPVVGMLMHLASNLQPDILFAVHQCARFTHTPRALHGDTILQICRHLKGTSSKGLILRPSNEL